MPARRATRPVRLDDAPLDYAPENELGVVFLFSSLARRRFGVRVERIRDEFPDCIGYRGEKPVRIEFEYRSRNFALHKHNPAQCDWIVCWIHNWPNTPESIRVVELRREFGLGFNVWISPLAGKWKRILGRLAGSPLWSVPSQASPGDLVLYYLTRPEESIADIFRITGEVHHVRAGWRAGKDYMARIRRVCELGAPIFLKDLRRNPVLRTAPFVRGTMRGRYRASAHWPELYGLMLAKNPSLKSVLAAYGPERLG